MRNVVFILLLCSVAASASAACEQAVTQRDMDACSGTRLGAADAALNASYQAVMRRLSSEGQGRLRAAQHAWLGFRDAECAFRTGGMGGGSATPMLTADCRRELTEARAKSLRTMQKCQEGDLSCPQ